MKANLKTRLIPALALVAAALSPQIASAVDGTITFNGAITAQTCVINGGTPSFAVALPTVPTSALASAGQWAGRTAFDIQLTNCVPASGNVHAYFGLTPLVDVGTGRLDLASGSTATDVQFQLLNGDYSPIALGQADGAQNSYSQPISGAGTATLNYHVEYWATGAATAGTATSSIEYTLIYQ